MSEACEDETEIEGNNLRPGQYDEGGHGGMATRELQAKQQAEAEQGGTEQGGDR